MGHLPRRLSGKPLDGDARINALAYLYADNTQGYHVALARALISHGVRESEPIRILTALPLAGRKETEFAYNVAYSKVAEGSLRADLAEYLEDEGRQECLALLDHDITPAERLYLDSVAVGWGTKTDKVVNLVRDTFKAGPDKLSALDFEWDRMVVGHGGDDETWTKMSLTEAMSSELSGESWEAVKASLDGMQAWRAGTILSAAVGALGGEVTADHTNFTAAERAQLIAAEGSFAAATTGGLGVGTTLPVMNESLITIRSVYDSRMARAQKAGAPPEVIKLLEEDWAAKRAVYADKAEWETSGAAEREAHLALAGNLTFADRLYLAQRAVNADLAVKVANECWMAGKVTELHTDAATPRIEKGEDSGPCSTPSCRSS